MDASWRDLLVLLRGITCVSVTCEAIADLAEQNIEVLPDLFHEVVFDLLVSNVSHVRSNGCMLLKRLCKQFALVLKPLLYLSCTDGVLFTIDDIDITKVVKRSGGQLLGASSMSDTSSTVYTIGWLKAQVNELRARIGLESSSVEVADAAQYDNVEEFLQGHDLREAHRGAEEEPENCDSLLPCQLNVFSTDQTLETWFARLLRVMIVGLLSPTWEVRHGYATGLTCTLEGLYPDLMSGSVFPVVDYQRPDDADNLPGFLCDDILCCGYCVLLLDRFMDFGCGEGDSVSPVKAAAGALVACALRCVESPRRRNKAWDLIVEMITSESLHWTVTLGGLIALKSFVRNNVQWVMFERPELFASLVLRGMKSAAAEQEEVACCACEVLEALSLACCSPLEHPNSSSLEHALGCLHALAVGVDEIVTAGIVSAQSTPQWEAPACLAKFSVAVRSLCQVMQSLMHREDRHASSAPVKGTSQSLVPVHLVLRITEVQRKLVGMLFAYTQKVQRQCMQVCLESLQCLRTMLSEATFGEYLAACPASAVEEMRAPLFSLLGSILCASCVASQFPIVDLQLEDSSATSAAKSGKVTGAAAVTLEPSAGTLDATVTACSAYHADTSRWCAVIDEWMAITALVGNSKSREQATISVRELIVYIIKCGAIGHQTAPSEMSEGSGGYKSAISSFQSTVGSFILRETERFARAAEFCGTAASCAPDSKASAWDLAGDTRSGNLVSVLAALAVGAGEDCVDGLLRAVSDVATTSVHAAAQAPADAAREESVPAAGALKKRRFVVVADDCEGPKPKKGSIPAPASQSREMGHIKAVTGGSSRIALLVVLAHLVLEVQLRVSQGQRCEKGFKLVRRELQDAIALLTNPAGQPDPAAEATCALLVPDIGCVVLTASSIAFNAAKEEVRLSLAAATANVILSALPDTERFGELIRQLSNANRTGRCSSWFINATIFALLKNCGENVHEVFASCLVSLCARAVDPQSLWSMCSALAACKSALRQVLVVKHALLEIVFSCVAQANEDPSDEVVKGAVAVLCLLTDTDWRDGGTGQSATEHESSVAALREIGMRLHAFLSREATSLPIGLLCARRRAAEVFHHLAQQRLDALVHCYEVWFAAALHGIADNEPAVRRSCVRAFRLLVPLASVAKQASLRRRNTEQQAALPSSDLIDHIFTKQAALKIQHSERPQDLHIMAVLSAKTNLCVQSSSALHSAQLRAYQWEGVSWLTQLRRFGLNGILADEMGLGKSLQALTALAVQRIESNCHTEPSLIVCPATLVLHWEEEISRYFPPDLLRPVRYSSALPGAGAGASGGASQLEGRDVVIASYEMVRRDVGKAAGSSLLGRLWETVIADEAHLVKNPAAGTTKAVCSLQSKHRIALSGTPLQNQVEELWSLMNFVLPDYIGDYQSFRRETVLPIQQSFSARKELKRTAGLLKASFEETSAPAGAAKKKRDNSLAKFHQAIEVSAVGLSLLRTLHKQVLPFILRRTKEMVAKDLPSKTIVDVLCPLSAQQAQLYEAHLKAVNITDEQVERELKQLDADEGRTTGASEENIDVEALRQAMAPVSTQAAPNLSGWGGMGSLGGMMLPAFDEAPPAPPRRNALQSLNYLKLLGVHPALVVAEGSYKARLLKSHTSSGKLFKLANLLLESGVMTRDDFSRDRNISELEGDADDPVKPENNEKEDKNDEDDQTEEGGDGAEPAEGGEADEPLTSGGKATAKKQKVKTGKSETAKGKGNKDKGLSESITTSAAADHACKSADAELLPPMHRCLIFAQHRAALDLVEEHVMRRYFPEVGYQRLDGSVDAAKRGAIARKFNAQERRSEPVGLYVPSSGQDEEGTRAAQVQLLKGRLPAAAKQQLNAPAGQAASAEQRPNAAPEADIRVLLLTTRACGLGLNLTAADTVIFLEHDWNPFADLQAMDRVHRLGQTHPVTVYRLLAESTVEARIMRLQGLKRNIADQVINEDNAGEAASAGADGADGAHQSNNNSGSSSGRQFGAVLMESLLHV